MKNRYNIFYNKLAAVYTEEDYVYSTVSGILRRRFINTVISRMPKGNLVEIGCGGMPVEWERDLAVYIDIAKDTLKRAMLRINSDNSFFISGDAQNLHFLKPVFDIAVMSETIEHLVNPRKAIEEIYKILKPSGIIFITCPNWTYKRPVYQKHQIIDSLGIEYPESDGYIHTAYKPFELTQICNEAGFEIINSGSFEKELRYWTKIPLILRKLFETLFGQKEWIDKFYNGSLNLGYLILSIFRIPKLMNKVVSNGRRTFVIGIKRDE